MIFPRHVGDPIPERDAASRISELRLELLPIDLIVQWRRCSVVADFLSHYFNYHFEDRTNAMQVLSYGLNELIENLAKFTGDKQEPVSLTMTHFGEALRVQTYNVARRPQAEALASRLEQLSTVDPEELFLAQLEHTASEDKGASGLGLITIKKDYQATIGAEIVPLPGPVGRFGITFTLELDPDAIERG